VLNESRFCFAVRARVYFVLAKLTIETHKTQRKIGAIFCGDNENEQKKKWLGVHCPKHIRTPTPDNKNEISPKWVPLTEETEQRRLCEWSITHSMNFARPCSGLQEPLVSQFPSRIE